MRLGIISDIHGNWAAFQAVIHHLKKSGIDKLICLGDIVNPLPGSEAVFDYLTENQVPILRGNHEDYVIYGSTDPLHEVNQKIQFGPVQVLVKNLTPAKINAMKSWPLTLVIKSERAGPVFLCHASPKSNRKGWKAGIDESLAEEISCQSASILVGGHWHIPQVSFWRDKILVSAGSVGLPLSGRTEPECLILEDSKGDWTYEHHKVSYNPLETVRAYQDSGWFKQGGPIAWLFLGEVLTGRRQLASLFPWLTEQNAHPQTLDEWWDAVFSYLKAKGDFTEIATQVKK